MRPRSGTGNPPASPGGRPLVERLRLSLLNEYCNELAPLLLEVVGDLTAARAAVEVGDGEAARAQIGRLEEAQVAARGMLASWEPLGVTMEDFVLLEAATGAQAQQS